MSTIAPAAKYRVSLGWEPGAGWWYAVSLYTDAGHYHSEVTRGVHYVTKARAREIAMRAIADDRKRRASHETFDVPLDEETE